MRILAHVLSHGCIALVVLAGCYRSRSPAGGADTDAASPCGAPIECVGPGATPCSRPVIVAPLCDAATRAQRCPSGARAHVRDPHPPSVCLPYHDAASGIRSLGGAVARIPTRDGRCLAVYEDLVTAAGIGIRDVLIEEDLTLPFGACPSNARFISGNPRDSVWMPTWDPSLLVQITGAFVSEGEATHVTYRLFRLDASAGFGLVDLGTGFGHFDEAHERIAIGPSVEFPASVDLGDGAFTDADGTDYVFGCPAAPAMLVEDCVLARIGAMHSAQYVAANGAFSPLASEAVRVFGAGPWTSSLFRTSGDAYVHVYVPGFGRAIESDRASHVIGPYAKGPTVSACALPSRDADAYCTGPVVHEERIDPFEPSTIVMSHSVGTTAANGAALRAAHPEDYWVRTVQVTVAP